MKRQQINFPEITLIGLSVRTNNANEIIPEKSKIAGLAHQYMTQQIANQFKHRATPGITYAAYTDYESDEHGAYTYFIGEVVNSLAEQDLTQFKTFRIPAGTYQKFTTNSGQMPEVVASAWQNIWTMTESDLAGKRNYLTDFEIYDERAIDPNNTVLDIFIGIEAHQ